MGTRVSQCHCDWVGCHWPWNSHPGRVVCFHPLDEQRGVDMGMNFWRWLPHFHHWKDVVILQSESEPDEPPLLAVVDWEDVPKGESGYIVRQCQRCLLFTGEDMKLIGEIFGEG